MLPERVQALGVFLTLFGLACLAFPRVMSRLNRNSAVYGLGGIETWPGWQRAVYYGFAVALLILGVLFLFRVLG